MKAITTLLYDELLKDCTYRAAIRPEVISTYYFSYDSTSL